VLTGVSYRDGFTGVAVYNGGEITYYEHEKISKGCHGTGDAYAAAFTGALASGKTITNAAKIAADFVVECIKVTQDDKSHWYGVKFELALPYLIDKVK
jgi:pyridoxine kinase